MSTSAGPLVFSYNLLRENVYLTAGVVGIAWLLLSWRLWRFTIRPLLHPDEPKELPYWIPFFGHLVHFFVDFNGAVEYGVKYFGNTREPFAMTVAGKPIYIVVDPKDVADAYRNEINFSREPITKDLYVRTGISKTVVDRLFKVDPATAYNEKLPKPLHPTDAMINFYHQHISPGDLFESFLTDSVFPNVYHYYNLDNAPGTVVLKRSSESTTVSLKMLCVEVLVKGITEAYYGPRIWEIKPDFTKWYLIWEKVNWKYIFNLPSFISQDMLEAKHELIDTLVQYFKIPRAEREHSNFFVNSMEDSLRETKLTDEEIGRVFMLQTWAILGNMHKTSFWMVANIVHDPALLESIRSEILPAFQRDTVDDKYLTEECPKLDSLYSEILRLTMSSPMVRDIVGTTVIRGKSLQKGNKVMVPFRQLHLNRDAWGPTPEALQAERFVNDKRLKSNLSYRPWGGGSSLCPGRFLTKKAIFLFVALLLGRYDISLDTGNGRKQSFPRADFSRPTPGIVSMVEGEDVILVLRPRRK